MRYLIILLAVALTGCRSGGHNHSHEDHNHNNEVTNPSQESEAGDHADEIVLSREQADGAGLVIETVIRAPFSSAIRTSGRIEPARGEEALVAAPSTGKISWEVRLSEGTAVGKGQTLARISARGVAGGDQAVQAAIEYETAAREFRRAEELAREQIVSQKELDAARARYESALSSLPTGAGEGGVIAASPLGGYLKNRLVREGEWVTAGQSIATVATNHRLQLRAEVSERYFGVLPSIAGANFRLAWDPALYQTGRPISYGKSSEGGFIPVLFEFPNTGSVVPGAWAEVWLLGSVRPEVMSVPRSALSEQQGLFFVYVQLADELYTRREVSVGEDNGARVEILGGLLPGERVVTQGAMRVRLAASASIIPEGHSH